MMANARLADWSGTTDEPLVIAGPCSAESETQVMETARAVAIQGAHVLRVGIWKPRTRPNSFEGAGSDALAWARNAGDAANLPVAVEVATAHHVEEALKHGIDMLWIGARTTVSPFAVQAIADALNGVDIPVMVKNPVNPELDLWLGAIERLSHAGIGKLAAIHRGFSTGDDPIYRNKPMWEIPIELKRRLPDLPMICDPSHICGNTELLLPVAQHAINLDNDGLMIEVHTDPPSALTDARQQITPAALGALLRQLIVKKPEVDDADLCRQIDAYRVVIDRLDSRLLDILSSRMEVSREIGRLKERDKITIYQPSRWDELVKSRLAIGRRMGLTEEFVFELFQRIHQESIARQSEDTLPRPSR